MYYNCNYTDSDPETMFSPLPVSHLLHNSAQAQWITALLSVSMQSCLGPSVAVNIFHQYLHVRSWSFSGTCRFLAGLFTFLGRQLVNWLRVIANYRRDWLELLLRLQKLQVRVLCVHFHDFMLSCEMRLVSHTWYNDEWTVGNKYCGWKLMWAVNYHWPHSMLPTLA